MNDPMFNQASTRLRVEALATSVEQIQRGIGTPEPEASYTEIPLTDMFLPSGGHAVLTNGKLEIESGQNFLNFIPPGLVMDGKKYEFAVELELSFNPESNHSLQVSAYSQLSATQDAYDNSNFYNLVARRFTTPFSTTFSIVTGPGVFQFDSSLTATPPEPYVDIEVGIGNGSFSDGEYLRVVSFKYREVTSPTVTLKDGTVYGQLMDEQNRQIGTSVMTTQVGEFNLPVFLEQDGQSEFGTLRTVHDSGFLAPGQLAYFSFNEVPGTGPGTGFRKIQLESLMNYVGSYSSSFSNFSNPSIDPDLYTVELQAVGDSGWTLTPVDGYPNSFRYTNMPDPDHPDRVPHGGLYSVSGDFEIQPGSISEDSVINLEIDFGLFTGKLSVPVTSAHADVSGGLKLTLPPFQAVLMDSSGTSLLAKASIQTATGQAEAPLASAYITILRIM